MDIHIKVKWQLSKQGIRGPVSHDRIAGSGANLTLWRLVAVEVLYTSAFSTLFDQSLR